MSRYIDAEPLEKNCTQLFADIVKAQPAADVEPVVHCKDCKYIDTCCRNIFTEPTSYETSLTHCSAGKRKEQKDGKDTDSDSDKSLKSSDKEFVEKMLKEYKEQES